MLESRLCFRLALFCVFVCHMPLSIVCQRLVAVKYCCGLQHDSALCLCPAVSPQRALNF